MAGKHILPKVATAATLEPDMAPKMALATMTAAATPPGAPVPLDRFRAFRVPKGTMVCLRPGVWHHAPFAVGGGPANVLIALPERTYANDCTVVELAEDEQIRILGD